MPNLPVHIDLAHKAAGLLDSTVLQDYLGAYLLGSTAPDIRALNGGKREDYHFQTLNFESIGDGVTGLFEAYPNLRFVEEQSGSTKAFIAGYMTHLILDESWIVKFYRPYFGNPRFYSDAIVGKVLDRALQLELDRLSVSTITETSALLSQEISSDIKVPFISQEMLGEWQIFVLERLKNGFSWERLRFMAKRIAEGSSVHPAYSITDKFLSTLPFSLHQLFEYVTREDLSNFKSRAVNELTHVVGEYLN